ncbi:MAG: AAA family ATPase [Terracidiphilus sp.]|jgi:Flp pilus assembly CpaE family ATPase
MATTPGEYDVLQPFESGGSHKRSGQDTSSSQHRNDDLNNPVGAFGLKIVLICPNDHHCSELASCLFDAQCGEVRTQTYYPSLQAGAEEVGGDCDVVIVELDSDPDHALGLVKRIGNVSQARIMVCSANPAPDLLMRCMRAGAREFLNLPVDRDQMVAAMVRAAAKRQPVQQERRTTGKLMAFMGTKGGAGVTTIATNFAIALAEHTGAKTLFLDLDLPLGDAALNLGVTTEFSTIDALERIDRLDASMLSRLTVRDRSGLQVLAAPGHYVSLQPSDTDIRTLLDLAAHSYDYVVVDLGSRLDLRGTGVFQIANPVFLVSRVDVADLRNCSRLISQYFGSDFHNIEVVLSRYKRNVLAIDDKEIARMLSVPVRWKIPADDSAVNSMQQQGVPLVRGNNSISKSIRKMAEELAPAGEKTETTAAAAEEEEEQASRKTKPTSRSKAKSEPGGILSIFSNRDQEPETPSAPEYTPEPETRLYKGVMYVKGPDNKWHAQGSPSPKRERETPAPQAEPVVEAQIAWSAPQPVNYGTALDERQLNATANVEGDFEYMPAVGETLAAGTHTLKVMFTPAQDPENPVEAEVQFTVNKLSPVIEWQQPEAISYGAALGEEHLNAHADIDGKLIYNPPAGTVLPEGVHALSVIFIPNDSVNYNTAVSVASLTVSRMVSKIEWPDPTPIFYGMRLSGTELNAKATIPGSFAYTPKEGTLLAAGMHKLTATFMPEQSEYYRESKVTVTLIVARATPEAHWQQPPDIVYGTPLGTEHFNIEARVPGSIEFSADAGEVLCAGRHTLIAYFTPADTANYSETEFEATLNIAKGTPTLNWENAAQIVYGTALEDSQLHAEASVPGSIEYTPGLGKLLPAGRHTIIARFTPSDMKNLEIVEARMILTVEKATPKVEWPDQISMIYGMPLGDRIFRISTAVEGSLAMTPAKGEILPAGTHMVHAVFLPVDSANYMPAEADVPVQVAKANPVITWETPHAIVYGAELTGEQLSATANVNGHFTFTPALGKKLGAGQHAISAVFVPDDGGNYQSVQATVQLTVEKAAPAIHWPEPEAIAYGEELSEKQLQARASVPGSFAYAPAAGDLLEAGMNRLTAFFTPLDTANYVSAQAAVKLAVNKLVPTLYWPDPASIEWGTPLSPAQLNAQASMPGSFVYTPAEDERLRAGSHTLSVTFLPEDSRNYAAVETSTTITVHRATPLIAWRPISPIVYGTALGADQLNAETNIPGVFVYRPAVGAVLPAGSTQLTATFLPEDDANYAEADATASLAVEKAVPEVEWRTPAPIEYGTSLEAQQLNASSSVPGTFTYMPATGSMLSAGSHMCAVLFSPDDSTNYLPADATVTLVVKKATPQITWPTPEAIMSGNPLSVAQLNAKASVPGKFAYIPRVGSVLHAGMHTIEATFVPADATNYTPVQTSIQLAVVEVKEVPIDWKSPAPIFYGTALGSNQLNAKASVPGTFVYSPPEGTLLAAGTQTLMVTFIPDDDVKYAAAQASVALVVKAGEQATNANHANKSAAAPTGASGNSINREPLKKKPTPVVEPQDDKRETRVYKGATYVKEVDGKWHLVEK